MNLTAASRPTIPSCDVVLTHEWTGGMPNDFCSTIPVPAEVTFLAWMIGRGKGGKGFHVLEDFYFLFTFLFPFLFLGIIRSSVSQVPLWYTTDRIERMVSG